MKNLILFLTVLFLLPINTALGQIIPSASRPKLTQPSATTATEKVAPTDADKVASTAETAPATADEAATPPDPIAEFTAKANDNLREELRDTTKNYDIKTRRKYLNVNHHIDKILLRQQLQKQGVDTKVAASAAETLKKPNVDPASNEQMNEYILNRADISNPAPDTSDTESATND